MNTRGRDAHRANGTTLDAERQDTARGDAGRRGQVPVPAPRPVPAPTPVPPVRGGLPSPFFDEDCCETPGCTVQRLGSPSTGTLLSVRDLSVAYRGRVALEHVDLDVHPGRVTALIGPSGCGKTSLLFCLNRLCEMVAGCEVSGAIHFEGRDVRAERDLGWLRRQVGMVFQRPNPFPLSIRQNLYLPLREHGCPRRELAGRAEEVLRLVGLWDEVRDRLDAPALELSGGQQQRLCIARALTLNPRLLLMDEPCSALDPIATETIERLVLRLRERVAVVIITHNLAQARRIADDVAVFWTHGGSGCVIESGSAEAVFELPQQPETVQYLAGARG